MTKVGNAVPPADHMRDGGILKAIDNLMRWAVQDEWLPHLDDVVDDHVEHVPLDKDEIFDSLRKVGQADTTLYAFILEDFCTKRFGDNLESNVVEDYLERHGWRESPRSRQYLESLRDSTASLFEVVAVDPGRSLRLRDLLRGGKPITVWETTASKSLAPWERIAARIVTVDGKRELTGAMLHYRFDWARGAQEAVEDLARKARKRIVLARRRARVRRRRRRASRAAASPMSKAAFIRTLPYTEVLSSFWTQDMIERSYTAMPELLNTDSEGLVISELRFPINGDEARVAALLDEIADFERVEGHEAQWVWSAPGSPMQRVGQHAGETPSAAGGSESSTTVLGMAQVEDGVLTLCVNSEERAERGRSILFSKLGGLVGPPQTSTHDVLQAIRESEPEPPPEAPPAEEELQAIHQFLDDHYRRTLDEPLPVLGGTTLRKAARTRRGREEALSWLKQLEILEYHRAADQGCDPYDTRWIWEELGLEDYR